MNATQKLHGLGQSLWLDNITRDLLNSGTLSRYINEFSVTGLTSNPTIFDHAIKNSSDYDAAIRQKLKANQVRNSSLNWLWRILQKPLTCSDPSTIRPAASRDEFRWKSPLC
jgi:Transaldolase/Fructose-6-phosphate aldolase